MMKGVADCCANRRPWKLILFAVLVVFISLYLILISRNAWRQYDYIGRSVDVRDTISMTGEGTVVAIPDIATVSMGLETRNVDVGKAQNENNDKINRLVDELKGLGVAKEDLKTSNYNVYPNYDWAVGQKLIDYSISQTLKIKIRDLTKISDILALAGKYNLNQVGSLQFAVDDDEAIKEEARLKAFEQAKSKAKALADAAGVKLGKVISFYETNNSIPYYESAQYGLGGAMDSALKAPDIQAGSQDVVVNVTIEYEIL